MNFTNDPRGASRFTGVGAVALVHVAIVAGLASGLVPHVTPKAPNKVEFTPREDTPKEPPPVVKVPTPEINQQPLPNQIFVEPPPVFVQQDKPLEGGITTVIGTPSKEPVMPPVGPSTVVTQEPPVATKLTARLACPTMGKPEVPAVNWSGEALFRVIATVTGGRVTATEIQTLRGSLDPKTRRAFQSAIDGTMRDTYRCNGDARFEQEFQFKVD